MVRQHLGGLRVLAFAVIVTTSITVISGQDQPDLGHVVGLARVTYISGPSVYIDAGREHGLKSGQTLEVLRDGKRIGVVRIDSISAIRSSCKVVEVAEDLAVGDLVRLPIPGDGSEPIRTFDEGVGSSTASATPSRTQAEASTAKDADPSTAANAADLSSQAVDTTGNPGLARVSHVDQNRVFIDSGENKGLRGGDNVRVLRANSPVAVLEVTDVSSDRAACKIVEGVADLDVGDLVRLPIRGDGDDTGPVAAYEVPETIMIVRPSADAMREMLPTPRFAKTSVNGRVGVRYLMVQDRGIGGGRFSQPALDVRLDALNMAGGHFDVAVDIRSRRTYRTEVSSEDEIQDQTRVYRLAASIHDPRGRFRLTAGRQFSPSLASVSTFDGVLASFNGNHVSTGLFAGTQPDPQTFGRSDEIEEYGAFLQLHNRPGSRTQWSITTGGIGSYQNGVINREYAYLQALLTSQRVSLYATQEVDYNRDWKILAGEDQISPTSSYLHFGVRPTRGLSLRVGYDNRRNIRLYRDLITPETEFDDTFRQGYWGGFTQRIAKRFRIGLNAKRSTSETAGDADTYTMIFGATGLGRRFNFFYRGSYYINDINEGSLQSLTTGIIITRQLRMSMMGGLRRDTVIETPDVQSELVWYGVGWDVSLGRHWFLQLSGERTDGEQEKNDQAFFSTTYRF